MDSWAPAPGEKLVIAWRGPTSARGGFIKAIENGSSPEEAAGAMVKIGRSGALVTPTAQALLDTATGLSPLEPQWAGIAGAEDSSTTPHREGFWRKMVRPPPRVLVLFTDGLGDTSFIEKRGGVSLSECVIKLDATVVVAPQAAAAVVDATKKLGKTLHDAIVVVHEHLSELDWEELSEEIVEAVIAMWKYGAPLVQEFATQVIEWVTVATEFLVGVDYIGLAKALHEALKSAAKLGVEFAKQLGPPALAAAQAVAGVSQDLIAILVSVDWEAIATAAYALASQGALLAVENAKEAGKLLVVAITAASEAGTDVAEEVVAAATTMAEKGAPVAKAVLYATAEFVKGAAEWLDDEGLPALNAALGTLAGWGLEGAAVLYDASCTAIAVAIEAGRDVAQALARVDYGPLADGAKGCAALIVAASEASSEAAKEFGAVMLPALRAAAEAGADVAEDAIVACEHLVAYATPVAEDAAKGVANAMEAAVAHISDAGVFLFTVTF